MKTACFCSLLILSAVACSPIALAEDDFLEGLKKDKVANQKPAPNPAPTPTQAPATPTMTPARLVPEPAAPSPTVRPGGEKKPGQTTSKRDEPPKSKPASRLPNLETLRPGDRISGKFVVSVCNKFWLKGGFASTVTPSWPGAELIFTGKERVSVGFVFKSGRVDHIFVPLPNVHAPIGVYVIAD